MEIEEVVDIVNDLNEEVYDKLGDDAFDILPNAYEIRSNGDITIIEVLGVQIWNSECDKRYYIEETDEYEPLGNYLRRTTNILLEVLHKLKLDVDED